MPDPQAGPPPAGGAADEVLRAVRERGGLPSVGPALTRLTRLLDRESEALHALADAILADASLTQRLLHLANTMPFRAGTPPVTTVTRAIMLLGVNRVQAAALSLVLLDGVVGPEAPRVYADFHQALLASSLAPLLLGPATAEQAEMACIAALLRNVGRMLLAVYAPQALAALRAGQEPREVLGCSLDELTTQLLQQWNVPERLVLATQPLPAGAEAAAADPIRAAAHFADEVAETVRGSGGGREAALQRLRERFAPALLIEGPALSAALEAAAERTQQFENAVGLARRRPAAEPPPVEAPPGALPVEGSAPSIERDAVGRPANAMAVLLAGLADATDALARDTEAAAVIQLVLETIYNGLGFARVVLAQRDAGGTLRVRTGFGQPRPNFTLPAQGSDLFSAALAKATDLHIADATAEKIRNRLPPWFAQQCAATRSFMLMPIAPGGRAVGMIYADRRVVDPAGPADEELKVLRALRSQVALALRSSGRG